MQNENFLTTKLRYFLAHEESFNITYSLAHKLVWDFACFVERVEQSFECLVEEREHRQGRREQLLEQSHTEIHDLQRTEVINN